MGLRRRIGVRMKSWSWRWRGDRAGRAARPAAALAAAGALALLWLLAAGGGARLLGHDADDEVRGSFAPADQPPQYPSARLYDLQHLRLELSFDLRRRTVEGTATNVLVPLLPGLDHLVFHSAGLRIARVRLAGAAGELPFATDAAAQTLTVRLPRAYDPPERLEVAIDYSAQPKAGLYVIAPDHAYPDRPWQLFSDGEPQLNRYWFPSWDQPDDRATSELLATVEQPLEVIGNGRLVEVVDRPGGRRTFHWLMEQPHSTYLVSVVIGEFSHGGDSWHGVPVDWYVPKALAARAPRAYSHTVDAMDFFSRVIGRPYPYAKYSQAAVYGFLWEGMENISATTETVDTLRDARAELDSTSDDLVAHELAHQWFGDLVTCRGWDQAWLNEGMATYFEALYRQHQAGEGVAGDDALAWKLDESRASYLQEDRERYRRPLVTRRYVAPIRMFDAHTYDKGALVLHMLRELTGEAGWWQGVRTYLARHALGTVTSRDLQSAFEDASGAELGALFDQFVYGAGYPELKLRWEYQPAAGVVRIEVRQVQALDGETGLFSFPVEVALIDGEATPLGKTDRRRSAVDRRHSPEGSTLRRVGSPLGETDITLRRVGSPLGETDITLRRVPMLARAVQDLYIPSPSSPRTVVFDPRGVLLKTADFDKPAAEWIEQLRASLPLAAQLDAARALAEHDPEAGRLAPRRDRHHPEADGDEAVTALGEALRRHRFHGLREVAAAALARIGSDPALAELRQGAADPDARVRAAVLAGFGGFPEHAELIALLAHALESDASYRARAAAATALGRFEDRRGEVAPLLAKALAQRSFLEEVPRAAIRALAELGAPGTFAQALRMARYGSPQPGRADAMLALAIDAAHGGEGERQRARHVLEGFLDDPDFEVRRKAPAALGELGDPAAIPALQRSLRAEVQDEQRRPREEAISQLRQGAAKPPPDHGIEERLRQLERANEVLQERLRQLQPAPAAPPAAAPASPPPG